MLSLPLLRLIPPLVPTLPPLFPWLALLVSAVVSLLAFPPPVVLPLILPPFSVLALLSLPVLPLPLVLSVLREYPAILVVLTLLEIFRGADLRVKGDVLLAAGDLGGPDWWVRVGLGCERVRIFAG